VACVVRGRSVRHRLRGESIPGIRVSGEVRDERGLVIPAVAFFQQERPKRRLHVVGCRTSGAIVGIEPGSCGWECGDERYGRLACLLLEPGFGDDTSV
jgi:hypothetical protein